MSIFNSLDYREILKSEVNRLKREGQNTNFQRLAEAMGIPKSYLSRVLNQGADFNRDQMYLACEYPRLNEEEREFLLILLDMARSGLESRRQKLLQQAQDIQTTHLQSEKHLSAPTPDLTLQDIERYYLNPLNQIVHICLGIDRYQSDLPRLAQDLKRNPQSIQICVQELIDMGVVKKQSSGYEVLVHSLHLPSKSPTYLAWRNSLKLMAQNHLNDLQPEDSYSFSVVFSANKELQKKLRSLFLKLLHEAEVLVKQAPKEEVFQMSFDLFSWT